MVVLDSLLPGPPRIPQLCWAPPLETCPRRPVAASILLLPSSQHPSPVTPGVSVWHCHLCMLGNCALCRLPCGPGNRAQGELAAALPPALPGLPPSLYLTHAVTASTLYLIASIVCSTQGNLGLEHMLTNGQSFIGAELPSLLCQIRCSRSPGSCLGSCSRGTRSLGSRTVCRRITGKARGQGAPGSQEKAHPWVLLLPRLARDPSPQRLVAVGQG